MNVQQMQEYKTLRDEVAILKQVVAHLKERIAKIEEARPILSRNKDANKV
jgi:prefoldin subunit 5